MAHERRPRRFTDTGLVIRAVAAVVAVVAVLTVVSMRSSGPAHRIGGTSAVVTASKVISFGNAVEPAQARSAGSAAARGKHAKGTKAETFSCSVEVTPSEAGKLAAKIASVATGGGTVCLQSGTFPYTTISEDRSHTGYVVVRPAKGASVTDGGFEIEDSTYIAIEHFGVTTTLAANSSHMSEGVRITGEGKPGSRYMRIDYDTIEDPSCNRGHGCPGPETGVIVGKSNTSPTEYTQVDYDYMRHVSFGGGAAEEKCEGGVARGQDVTMYDSDHTEIEHDVFYLAQGHYLQGGDNTTVAHDLFMGGWELDGPYCEKAGGEDYHQNLWQMWSGSEENDVYSDNIALGEELSTPGAAATDGVLAENGPNSGTCSEYVTGLTMEGNLFVNAGSSYPVQIYYTAGHSYYKHNTVAHSSYGTGFELEAPSKCGVGEAEITKNVNVETTAKGEGFSLACAGALCLIDENVADDDSTSSEKTKVEGWKPSWVSPASCPTPKGAGGCWDPFKEVEDGVRFPKPPRGYYVEKGLPFKAGYEGKGGPVPGGR